MKKTCFLPAIAFVTPAPANSHTFFEPKREEKKEEKKEKK